jgi:Ran-interacting Mog1 protein
MASFHACELYGGTITANLPVDLIDSSNIRQIPDHQEVYLSPKTLTTVIFEINQYVSPITASQTDVDPSIISNNPESGGNQAPNLNDKAAALYHLRDLIDPNDTLNVVTTPKAVQMQSPSLQGLPTFIVRGKLTSREKERRAPSVLPEEYQHAPEVIQTNTTIRLLLIRLESKATDLCVTVNVPWKELGAQDKVDEEEAFADSILENIIVSLDVKDFGLFGE